MISKEKQALRAWARLAPSTFQKLESFNTLEAKEQRATLEGWVAWLNSTGAADPATVTFRRELTRLLDEFIRGQKGKVDQAQLASSLGRWLETAGEVGGPEQEQDPTLPHSRQWHSNQGNGLE
jgi:hypothetical protein